MIVFLSLFNPAQSRILESIFVDYSHLLARPCQALIPIVKIISFHFPIPLRAAPRSFLWSPSGFTGTSIDIFFSVSGVVCLFESTGVGLVSGTLLLILPPTFPPLYPSKIPPFLTSTKHNKLSEHTNSGQQNVDL